MNVKKPIENYEEDCFAFSNESYTTDIHGKVEINHLICKVLKRKDCHKCSFYKHKDEYNSMEIEHAIRMYNTGKSIKEV